MNSNLKNATLSVVLCIIIILLNTDLSCLRTYLAKRLQPLQEHERTINVAKEQRYAVALPDVYLLSVKKDVYEGMSSYVHLALVDTVTVNNIHTPEGVGCRGSPSIRSP